MEQQYEFLYGLTPLEALDTLRLDYQAIGDEVPLKVVMAHIDRLMAEV